MSFWIHGSSTGHLDFSNDVAAILAGDSVSAAAINAGGTGYVAGDILTITETGATTNISAQIEVVTVAAGVITATRIYNAGSYSVNPTTLTANALVGGSGSSATIDLTMSDLGWTVDRDAVYDGGTERGVVAHGEGSGTDAIYVGWRTYSSVVGGYYNWEVHGMTGYTAGLDMGEQPGVSQGDFEAATPADDGCYMILTNTTFNWWLNINSYRIIMSAAIGSSYFHSYMGWGNRFGTSTEYPYPMIISTPCEIFDANATRSEKMSSITDPWMGSSLATPVHTILYMPGGDWQSFHNRRATNPYDDRCVVPTMRPQVCHTSPGLAPDFFMDGSAQDFGDVIYSLSSGTGGATPAQIRPTGDNDDYILWPCFFVSSDPTIAILMEIDEVKWVYAFGGPASEDRFIESDGTAWRLFQNGNRTDAYAYLAIKEAD